MTNPLMEVADLEAVVAFAREHGLVSLIDNTFASPCNFCPLRIGFDIELHSATKYLNGHSDIVAGVVVGSAAHVKAIKHKLNHLGGSAGCPRLLFAATGLEDPVAENAATRRKWVAAGALFGRAGAVARVNYPGLENHPQYERAQRLFAGAGGVLSFELHGGVEAAERLLSKLVLPALAPVSAGSKPSSLGPSPRRTAA